MSIIEKHFMKHECDCDYCMETAESDVVQNPQTQTRARLPNGWTKWKYWDEFNNVYDKITCPSCTTRIFQAFRAPPKEEA